jgi:hypothetical protein
LVEWSGWSTSTWEDWESGATPNGGYLLRTAQANAGAGAFYRSADNGSNEPYWEIDYNAGGPAAEGETEMADIVAGVARHVTRQVKLLDGSAIKSSGTVKVRLYDPATDKYWSTDGGGTWEADASATYPTATHKGNGGWYYLIPALATSGMTSGSILQLWFNDNDTEASVAATGPDVEFEVVPARKATIADTNQTAIA